MWGNGRLILSGVYQALRSYGVGLNNIHTPPGADLAGEQAVIADIGVNRLHFYFDRLELHATNFTNADLPQMGAIVQSVAEWLEDVAPDSSINRHVAHYIGHGTVGPKGDQPVASPPFATTPQWRGGEALGAGIILNYRVRGEEYTGTVRFTLDRSVQIAGGLFVSLESELIGLGGRAALALSTGEGFLSELLEKYDLEIEA